MVALPPPELEVSGNVNLGRWRSAWLSAARRRPPTRNARCPRQPPAHPDPTLHTTSSLQPTLSRSAARRLTKPNSTDPPLRFGSRSCVRPA